MMKTFSPSVVALAIIVAGVSIVAIIVGEVVITAAGHPLPDSLSALFATVSTGFVVAIASVISHTLGFANGTTNGENAAQAQALRTVMATRTNGQSSEEHS